MLRQRTLIFLTGLFFLFTSWGCGQKVTDSVPALDNQGRLTVSGPTVVVLPLADYTQGPSPDDSLRRQMKIQTAIAYRLAQHGFSTPLEEDVLQCLADMGIIRILESASMSSPYHRIMERELSSGWSEDMRNEIAKIMAQNQIDNRNDNRIEMTQVGLNPGNLREIGRRFGGQYILRGRIVEYESRDGYTLNPFRRGLLPFFFDTTSATIFGVADSEKYDLWQDMAIGAALGAGFGASANMPFNAPSEKSKIVGSHPRFATVETEEEGGYSSSHGLNAATWGLAGASAAYLAKHGGKINKGVVQISLALQDARTGKVIWANRAEKQVAPVTAWADPSVRKQIDTAIEEAARSLIDDLAKSLKNGVAPQVAAAPLPLQAAEEEPASAEVTPPALPVEKDEAVNPALLGS